MTYPKIILTKPVRRGFMIFLFIVFFVISPLILLYTTGYRYDFSTYQIKETGVLSIDTLPKNMSVYLNDVLIEKKIPIYLPNRAPGTYTIKLSAPGYKDWQKNIVIESKKTTYIKNVTLYKEKKPTQILNNFNKQIIDFKGSFDGQYLCIITLENNISEIYLYNTKSEQLDSISRINAGPIKINWSPYANYLTIETIIKQKYNIQIIDANNQNNSGIYMFDEEPEFQWSKNNNFPTIYLREGGDLKNNSDIYIITTNDKTKFGSLSTSTKIWHVDNQNNIWNYTNNLTNLKNTLSDGNIQYHLDNNQIKIIDINQNRIIYQTNNETKVIKIDNEKIVETHTLPTQQIIYNNQTNEWIIWSWWELWTIYDDGNVELLDRTGEKMINIKPFDKYGVLLLSNENKMTGFNPGYYISHTLLENVEIKEIFTNINQRKIYFSGTVENKTGIFELEY